MRQAGDQAIKQRAHVIDFSTGAEAHEIDTQQLLVLYKQLQPFIVQMQMTTKANFEPLYQQMAGDLQREDFCGIDFYLTVWGHKWED